MEIVRAAVETLARGEDTSLAAVLHTAYLETRVLVESLEAQIVGHKDHSSLETAAVERNQEVVVGVAG